MLSKSKILMSLNTKQKPLCQLATTDLLLPQGAKKKGNTKKMTKARLGLVH